MNNPQQTPRPDPSEVLQWLDEAIGEARQGRRPEARKLLERVIEADAGNVDGWWWLGQVVDDLEEHIICLENVITLDAQHEPALLALEKAHRAREVRGRQALQQREKPAMQQPQPDMQDELRLDSPLQCVYCAHITHPDDTQCGQCGRSLLRRERPENPNRMAAVIAGTLMIALLLLSFLEMFSISFRQAITPGFIMPFLNSLQTLGVLGEEGLDPQWMLSTPVGQAILGNPQQVAPEVGALLNTISFVRFVVLLVSILLLIIRLRPAYYLSLAVLLGGLGWSFYLFATGLTGVALVTGGLLFSLAVAYFLFKGQDNFVWKRVRMKVKLHPSATSASGAYLWGMRYAQQKMFGLATLHFRKAVSHAPHNGTYYKQLGKSYAQIGRYDRSVRALEEAVRLKPDDVEISQILAMVRELQRNAESTGIEGSIL